MFDWHHVPLLGPVLQVAEEQIEQIPLDRLKFSVKDLGSVVAVVLSLAGMYYGLYAKFEALEAKLAKYQELEMERMNTVKEWIQQDRAEHHDFGSRIGDLEKHEGWKGKGGGLGG